MLVNQTSFGAASQLVKAPSGAWQVVVAVKATYGWRPDGSLETRPPRPFVRDDEYAGSPDKSGILRAAELGPRRPRVDVLLAGAITFPRPVTWADVGFAFGRRLAKVVRVFGERHWTQGMVAGAVPSEPRPCTSVPIAWERAFGGHDDASPKDIDLRNPVGSGIAADETRLWGKPAPQFENPASPIASAGQRPAPWGFGPIAPHWQPRAKLAGTYDESWAADRAPLLPTDFNPLFFNLAPADQQLDGYVPHETLRLMNLNDGRTIDVMLPAFEVPLLVATEEALAEDVAQVDMVVIEPEERCFSLIARAAVDLEEDPLTLRQVIVGPPTPGMLKALETGRDHPAFIKAREDAR